MSQAEEWGLHPTGPANGTQVAARANATFNALLSSNSGPSAPGYAERGTIWEDTSEDALKRLDGSNWRTIAMLDNVGLVRIHTETVDGAVSAVDFTLPEGYDEFVLRALNVRGSADALLALRVSTDGGSTYMSSSNYRVQNTIANNTTLTATNTLETYYTVSPNCDMDLATNVIFSTVSLSQYVSGRRLFGRAHAACRDSTSAALVNLTNCCEINVSATITNIRLMMSTGNITEGLFILDGVRQ